MPDRSESRDTAPAKHETADREIAPPAHETADMLARALRWRTIWPQVIAHAWAEPKFRDALKKNACQAIWDKFQYKLSPELVLTIKDAPAGKYNPDKPVKEDRWEHLPKMELTLYIPPAPPECQQAVAITHYSETGRTYPMTSG
jgi:ribosomally synthesized peptide (two-chain TOMM family)